MKKLVLILLCVSMVLSLTACGFSKRIVEAAENKAETVKTFRCDDLSIELTNDFMTMNFIDDTYNFIWGSGDVTVMGLYSEFEDDILQNMDVFEYAQAFRDNLSESDPSEVTLLDTIPTIEHTTIDEKGEKMIYLLAFYKAEHGIWLVTFGAEEDDYSEHYSDICKYAKTVKCN